MRAASLIAAFITGTLFASLKKTATPVLILALLLSFAGVLLAPRAAEAASNDNAPPPSAEAI